MAAITSPGHLAGPSDRSKPTLEVGAALNTDGSSPFGPRQRDADIGRLLAIPLHAAYEPLFGTRLRPRAPWGSDSCVCRSLAGLAPSKI